MDVMQKVPELLVNERISTRRNGERPESKEESVRMVHWRDGGQAKHLEEDTEEMRKWRGMSQSEMDLCWKKLAERMEEEVQDEYKVEESKREASRGRGALLEWRRVRKNKKYRTRKW